MTSPVQADVVVPVYADVEVTRRCLESVLANSGPALRTLIIVDDRGPEPEMPAMLEALRRRDDRVRLLQNEVNLGFVATANRGMSVRRGDVVILNSDTEVPVGWLTELVEVLHSHDRIAAVTPLSNNATLASVPTFGAGVTVDSLRDVRVDLSGLPRWTDTPTGVGFCLAMRDEVLNLIGLFDPAYGRGYNEENDWCQRARALGFSVVRANRCLVFHHGEVSFQGARAELDEHNGRRLVARYPSYLAQNADFESGPHARVAAIAVSAQVGPLKVCLDLSHLVAPAIHGTSVYGTQLARALSQVPGIALTVRATPAVVDALAPDGVSCVDAGTALEGFHVVHKPTQVYRVDELLELLDAEGHLVFTWQDLIAYRSPAALGAFERTREFRALTWAALSAAQGVVAISAVAARELLELLPTLASRLTTAPLGVDVGAAPSAEEVRRVRRERSLPARYVVHTGSDYPHKNLELLLEAWALVPRELQVDLVLAGPPSNLAGALYTSGRALPEGVRLLGELPPEDVLPTLAGASVAVLPSVYEGFGLLALEAMVCRVPIIAAGVSGLREVVGDAGVTLTSLSPQELAAAIIRVLGQPAEAARLVAAGTRRVRSFDWKTTAAETAALYQRIARSPDEASLTARAALRTLLRRP